MTGRRAAPLVAGLLAFALYLPTVGNGFVFDDRGILLENPLLHDLRDLPRLFVAPYWNTPRVAGGLYRPITSASFAVDRALARGFRPGWFHLVNAALHGMVTALLTLLGLRLFPGVFAGFAAGVLFAVHPVHAEAVAGVVGRAEILAAVLTFGMLLLDDAARRDRGRAGDRAAFLAPVLFLLGVLSKESALTAPALVVLLARTRGGVPPPQRGRLVTLWGGYAAAAIVALFLRSVALGDLRPTPVPFVDNPAAAAGPIGGRLAAIAVLPRYALLLVWPQHLSADYSYAQIPLPSSLADPWLLAGLVFLISVPIAGVVLLRRLPAAGFALLVLPVGLALTANLLFFIGTLLAERLLYLPSAGLCLVAGMLLARMPPRLAAPLLGVVATLGAGRTLVRLPEWRDDFSLYRSAALVSPKSARIRYNLGNAWLARGDTGAAVQDYRRALAIYPAFADAEGNLGMAYLQAGKGEEALAALSRAVADLPHNAEVRVNLGSARRFLGDEAGAESEFRRALEIDPTSANAWNNLGSLLLRRGDIPGAIAHLEKAVEASPEFAVFRINLADAYNAAGRDEDARRQFEAADRIDPALPEVARGRGEVLLQHGDRAAAEREFRAAAEGSPPSARAANYLGWLLSQRGDFQGAVRMYEKALALDPSLWDAHLSLGIIFAERLGDRARAAEHFRRSLLLEPSQPGAEALRKRLQALEAG